jgi:hypothetical protein
MEVPCAWTITTGSPDVTVAVVDGYFDPSNSDLLGKIINTVPPSAVPGDRNNDGEYDSVLERHGTAMVGGVAAVMNNGLCIAGTGGATTVNAYSALGSSALQEITNASLDGNRIISVAYYGGSGFSTDTPQAREAVRSVLIAAVERGSTIVFAAGRTQARHVADIPGVILVGFGAENGSYIPYGTTELPDINIEVVVPANQAHRLSGPSTCARGVGGSSLGSAFLSGIVALMLDVNPCLTPAEIEQIVYNTSGTIPNGNNYPQFFDNGKGLVNAYQAVLAARDYVPPTPQSLVVDAGQTIIIEDEQKAYNDIKVRSGGVLKIRDSKINIVGNQDEGTYEGRILVYRGAKLIVDNSTITNADFNPCDGEAKRWDGIRVHGNITKPQPNMYDANGNLDVDKPIAIDGAGVVMLKNGSIIKNAVDAVATTVPGFPYPDQVERWGGLVIAENTTFLNNFRAVHLTRYPARDIVAFSNQSRFDNCYFTANDPDGNSVGITAWDTDTIRVTNSVFKNIGRESIGTIDGGLIVEDGNRFEFEGQRGNHAHVLVQSTFPFAGFARVGSKDAGKQRNTFSSEDRGDVFVYGGANSGGRSGLQVFNNDFYGEYDSGNRFNTSKPVVIDGPSRFTVLGNTFVDSRDPIFVWNTGSDMIASNNRVSCNVIDEYRLAGIRFDGDNSGVQFLRNHFLTGSTRRKIDVNGAVAKFQGSLRAPANNIFMSTATIDIDVASSAPSFRYFYTDRNLPVDDQYEPQGASNYLPEPAIVESADGCEDKILSGFVTKQGALNAQTVFNEVRNDVAAGNTNRAEEMQDAMMLRDAVVLKFVGQSVVQNNLAPAMSVLATIEEPAGRMLEYGLMVGTANYPAALNVLTEIDKLGASYDDFVYTQLVNLERLTSTKQAYELAPADSTRLDGIAMSASPYRSYARALMLLLKDRRYLTDDDEAKSGEDNKSSDVTTEIVAKPSMLSVLPNPVEGDQINFVLDKIRLNASLDLITPQGRIISTTNLGDAVQGSIPAPKLKGIYWLRLTTQNESETVKVVVLHRYTNAHSI